MTTAAVSPSAPRWERKPLQHSMTLGLVGALLLLVAVSLSAYSFSYFIAVAAAGALVEAVKFFIVGLWKKAKRR